MTATRDVDRGGSGADRVVVLVQVVFSGTEGIVSGITVVVVVFSVSVVVVVALVLLVLVLVLGTICIPSRMALGKSSI